MTCATSSFMLVSLTLLADAFLFVFCASYLLYVYSNIISVDNIIITNNKIIQLFGSSRFLPTYFLSRILVHFCIFLEWKLLPTHWGFSSHKSSGKNGQMQCPSQCRYAQLSISQPRQELYSQSCSTVLLVHKPEGCYSISQKDCLLTL